MVKARACLSALGRAILVMIPNIAVSGLGVMAQPYALPNVSNMSDQNDVNLQHDQNM